MRIAGIHGMVAGMTLALCASVQAGIIVTAGPGSGVPFENVMYNQSGLTTTSPSAGLPITGATNQTSTVINIAGMNAAQQGVSLQAVSGQGAATIQTVSGGAFGSVLITPNASPGGGLLGLTSFNDFRVSVAATQNGSMAITVNGVSQGTFNLNGSTLNTFRINGGDAITSVSLTASGNIISNVNQIRLGGLTGPQSIPPVYHADPEQPYIPPAQPTTPAPGPVDNPEPASLLVWGCVLALGAAARFRRRRIFATAG